MRKMKVAVLESSDHVVAHELLEDVLNPDDVAEWRMAVLAWEKDAKNNCNPFEPWYKGESSIRMAGKSSVTDTYCPSALTGEAVRLAMNEEEAKNVADGTTEMLHEEVSPCDEWSGPRGTTVSARDLAAQRFTNYVSSLRHRLKEDSVALGEHATDRAKSSIIQRSTALRTKISRWYEVQSLYCPMATMLRKREETE